MNTFPQYHLTLNGYTALVVAIIRQARTDLRPHRPSQERAASIAFFANTDRHCEFLCGLVGLDYALIQAMVRQQYPDLF